jgi:large subunit ribosomal protein L35
MPKMKSKSGAKKRFKVMGSGRIKRSRAYQRHNLEHKSSKRGRRLRKEVMVDESNLRQVKRMLLLA